MRPRETIPETQAERNLAFTAAVRAGRADIAAALARAPVPEDAEPGEIARWELRRRLYK